MCTFSHFVKQPGSLEELTVDPVEDDIEIVDENVTSDAFAVCCLKCFFSQCFA